MAALSGAPLQWASGQDGERMACSVIQAARAFGREMTP